MDPKDLKPIFDYLDEFKADVNQRFDGIEGKIDKLQTSVDNLANMVKGFEEEMIVNRKRIDVLEKWARQVSEKVGIPLPF